MKMGFCIYFLIVFVACKQQENTTAVLERTTDKKNKSSINLHTVSTLKQYLLDSIDCFESNLSNDTLLRDDEEQYSVFTGTINKKKVGIIVIQDSAIFIVQVKNGQCTVTDSSLFSDYALDFMPVRLNADNQTDFLIESAANMNGMKRSYMLIADNNGYLHFRDYPFYPNRNNVNLWNIVYDSATDLIRKYYYGSAFGMDTKEIYQWNGDSLRLVRGVEQNRSSAKYEELNFYKVYNGKRFDYKTIRNPSQSLFDTAIWKDD